MRAVVDRQLNGRRTGATPYTVERRIVGTPAEVTSTVARVRRSGRLVAMTTPRWMPAGDARVWVNVRFLAAPTDSARQSAADRRRVVLRTVGCIAAVLVPVAVIAAGLFYVMARLVDLLPNAGVVLILAVIVWRALRRADVCAGLHCTSCSHGGRR